METWMIHALLASVFTGIFGIFQKIETEKPSLNRDSFIFYAYLFGLIANIIIFLFLDVSLIWDPWIIGPGIIIAYIYIYVLKLRHNCLQYMSSSSYFINYRIFTAIGLLGVGAFIFAENISFNEYLGVGLGFIIFYLLIEKKESSEQILNLKKGYFYLGISILLAISIWAIQKSFTLGLDTMWTFLLTTSASGVFAVLTTSPASNYKQILHIPNRKAFLFLLITGLVFGPGYIFHLYALFTGGDIAIVYKIVSYSLFIPIVFSIIYYKEPLTPKKIIAFILTILSIGLFI